MTVAIDAWNPPRLPIHVEGTGLITYTCMEFADFDPLIGRVAPNTRSSFHDESRPVLGTKEIKPFYGNIYIYLI
jgi:hypothetical protein